MAKIITKIFIVACICFFIPEEFHAQTEPQSFNTVQQDTNMFVMKKSPWGAVLRSAVIPGLGQFYNESYWKIPVIWGVFGYLGYNWSDQNDKYETYRDLYDKSFDESTNTGNSTYQRYRDFYRDQRDMVAVFIGLAYLLNLVDAYVDAHLFDFSVNESMNQNSINLSVRISF